MMSRIDSRHWKICTGRHFQNGHPNVAQMQHCPISRTFHMCVDYDVPNLPVTIFKWPPQNRTNSTLSDFNGISYVGRLWYPEFIPDIEKFLAVVIFKMAAKIKHCPISSKFDMWVDYDVPNWFLTSKNFYRSPFSKWPPQYRTNSTLFDFNEISYVGRLWWPELIPDKNSTLFDFKGSFWFIF